MTVRKKQRRPGPKNTFWTNKRVEAIKQLWTEGKSASQIALHLGHGATRNAVISKLHRLGLSGRTPIAKTASRAKRIRLKKNKPTIAQMPAFWGRNTSVAPVPVEPYREKPEPAEYVPLPGPKVTILRRRESDGAVEENPLLLASSCRWPIGDPREADFHFCGHPKQPGLSYCGLHAKVAYAPPPKLQRAHQIDVAANREHDEAKGSDFEPA